jgi:hypothetical protein
MHKKSYLKYITIILGFAIYPEFKPLCPMLFYVVRFEREFIYQLIALVYVHMVPSLIKVIVI